jgi:hypothetical protein
MTGTLLGSSTYGASSDDLPSLVSSSSSGGPQKLEDDESIPPASSLRIEIENYLRLAKHRLEVRIFQSIFSLEIL